MFPSNTILKTPEDLMKFMNEALKNQDKDKKINSNIDSKIIEMINKQNNVKK